MKRMILLLLACLLLAGCGRTESSDYQQLVQVGNEEIPYKSRFTAETVIQLCGDSVDVEGKDEGVFTSRDIIYYEDRESYDSGNPYGEGEEHERHTAQQAQEHLVVNITQPGAYRVTGELNLGQIRVNLGEDAYEDPNAVVELILDDTSITCTVAPAILFMNVYESDGKWSVDTAQALVDTSDAGANLILEGENKVTGSHVAKIYKDTGEEKKLWKQDGAIYSYMSMNVYGPGKLDLTADNEGLDTELHLTVNGGNIAIRSDNDGINTNEDGVSVTTIHGGNLHIIAGLGEEGDGIDSNGYLVINGGTVIACANPAADAGLDSDLGSFINGGQVIALGSTMDWAESESEQVTMNLQFSQYQSAGSAVVVTRQDGTVIFAYDPSEDEVLAENQRQYMGAILSCPNFHVGENYCVYLDGTVTGTDLGGMYDVLTVTGFEDGRQMAYTGTDVMMGPGGMMGFGGRMPQDGERPPMPEGDVPPDGERPEFPAGEVPTMPEGGMPQSGERPEFPEGEIPQGEWFQPGQRPDGMEQSGTAAQTAFYMQDKVNFFSGLVAAQ